MDIVAPGRDIVTLGRDGAKATVGGTSAAAAIVSGACALMLAVNPALTPAQIRGILRETASKIGSPAQWSNGYSDDFGYGNLNVYEAVAKVRRMAMGP
jgi:subtilisin family serine protease